VARNIDPGTQNYQLDNREQAYQFFSSQFHLPIAKAGSVGENDVKTSQELAVTLPADNLTILSLARALAEKINKEPVPGDPRLEAKGLWAIVAKRPEDEATMQGMRSIWSA
jgi:hypothetical protein